MKIETAAASCSLNIVSVSYNTAGNESVCRKQILNYFRFFFVVNVFIWFYTNCRSYTENACYHAQDVF